MARSVMSLPAQAGLASLLLPSAPLLDPPAFCPSSRILSSLTMSFHPGVLPSSCHPGSPDTLVNLLPGSHLINYPIYPLSSTQTFSL